MTPLLAFVFVGVGRRVMDARPAPWAIIIEMLRTIRNLLGNHGYAAHWAVFNRRSLSIHYQAVSHGLAARNDPNQTLTVWRTIAAIARLSMWSPCVSEHQD